LVGIPGKMSAWFYVKVRYRFTGHHNAFETRKRAMEEAFRWQILCAGAVQLCGKVRIGATGGHQDIQDGVYWGEESQRKA